MPTDGEKRYLLLTTAWGQANLGAHYLNGSDGATPGYANGMGRSLSLAETYEIDGCAVHAARNDYDTCRGRYQKMKGSGGKRFATGTDDRDVQLPKYLTELSESWLPSALHYKSFKSTGLYPRRADDYIYLGEDCRGRKHFDCESFIAWVIVEALKKDKGTWRKSIEWYEQGGGGRLDVFRRTDSNFPLSSEFLDGDMLIRLPPEGHRHMAFTAAKGKFVVHASGRSVGVISAPYSNTWSALARFKDEYI